jgi:hypothetical protein
MATLAEIRAKLLAQENRGANNKAQFGGDNGVYAFWNIPEGQTATIRFLPDSDATNTYFWRERQMIRIPFSGVLGGDEHKPVIVTVPCMEMWGETCPIHAEIRPWFKDPAMEELGRKYWKKKSYLFQGFVVDSPVQEDSTPDNPIRRFVINPSIFNIIKAALMDPDFPEIPTDYEQGTDFKLTKTTKGQYADYSTSNWARRERSLNEAERNAIAEFGLFNLNDFMPKKPNAEELRAIFEMFEASVDGQLYDPARWGTYYRPAGVQIDTGASKAPAAHDDVDEVAERPAPVAKINIPSEAPAAMPSVTEAPKPAGTTSAQDILAAIRARKNG